MQGRWTDFTQSMNRHGLNRTGLNSVVSFIKNVATMNVLGDENNTGMTQICDNIYAMGFPCSQAAASGTSIDVVSSFLRENHSGRFMVWNLSEKQYDFSLFENQVVEFQFPGYPAPPLDKIFSICRSIDGWLRADDKHIAVVHCLTGRGRTVAAIACYLCWIGRFTSTDEALEHIAAKKGISKEHLIIPSQTRYLQYFSRILSDNLPSTRSVRLKKIIMNSIPMIDEDVCRPYIQIFKYAKILYSSAKSSTEIKSYKQDDAPVIFEINQVIEGDILIRMRHLAVDGARVSILRFSFHTGYVCKEVERFKKTEIDGACSDVRFNDDFVIDVVWGYDDDDDNNDDIPVSSDYWKSMTKRSSIVPKLATIPRRFSLFENDDNFYSSTAHETALDDEKMSQNELDDYVRGLENIDTSDINIDSETEDLLAELKKEIQGEQSDEFNSESNAIDDGTMHHDKLDNEIAALLADNNDNDISINDDVDDDNASPSPSSSSSNAVADDDNA